MGNADVTPPRGSAAGASSGGQRAAKSARAATAAAKPKAKPAAKPKAKSKAADPGIEAPHIVTEIITPAASGGLGDNPYAPTQADLDALSAKGRRTRDRLLVGARRAFEHSGSYVDTRITDIVRESGVAYGSFYTYFDSKEQLFFELAVEVVNEMYAEGTSRYRGDDPVERMYVSNRQFLSSYREHAAMMTIIEQAAALYPELRALRRRLRERFVKRITANLDRLKERGLVEESLDSHIAAHALVSMTDNFCYVWFVLGEEFETDAALSTITTLWANSVGLRR